MVMQRLAEELDEERGRREDAEAEAERARSMGGVSTIRALEEKLGTIEQEYIVLKGISKRASAALAEEGKRLMDVEAAAAAERLAVRRRREEEAEERRKERSKKAEEEATVRLLEAVNFVPAGWLKKLGGKKKE
jgi:hypothetical protein